MNWRSLLHDSNRPTTGSEGGKVILDQEHSDRARVTLEKDCTYFPYAITCGLYGWMVHTCFFRERSEAEQTFEAMKLDLEKLLGHPEFSSADPDSINSLAEELSAFVNRY